MVADISKWYVWEWPPVGQGDLAAPSRAWQGTCLTRYNIRQLARLFSKTICKEWVLANLYELFGWDVST